jgi:uncharacterized RDD family membrane protein YckC
MTVQPGWYADPAEPTTQRYWDGEGWIGAPLPVDATAPSGPPPERIPERRARASDGQAQPVTPVGDPGGSGAGGTPGKAATPELPPGTPPPDWAPQGYPPHPWLVPPPRPHGLPLASLGARLVARTIDIAILFGLNIVVNGWFVWRFWQESRPFFDEVVRRSMAGDSSTEGLPPTGQANNLQIVILLIATALWVAYEVPAVANSGQTFGKRIAGVKVVPLAANERLGFGHSLRRWNLLGLPTFLWGCCGIGLLLQLVDCAYPLVDRPLRQALHDKRAQTVVVAVPRGTAGDHPAPDTAGPPPDSTDRTNTPTPGGPTP